MKELIERQAAIDVCYFFIDLWRGQLGEGITIAIKKRIAELPSAQPEIVRCKDCKHHWTHRCMDSMPTEICDLNQTFYDPNIDFCSLAERRTDE